jgi:release factor glutamine methyltransferase
LATAEHRARLRAQIERAAAVLDEAGVPSPRVDATVLAAHVLGVAKLVVANPPDVPVGFADEYAALVERRRRREPLQHIVGFAGFRRLSLRVEPGVFVPRPETELVAAAAIDEAAVITGRAPVVVDLCSGSGAIAASVCVEVPGAAVVAVDADEAAVALTRANLDASGWHRARALRGDVADPGLLGELDGAADVVVSNPPYIPPDAVPVDPEVRDHDPASALYGGGADGLDVARNVIRTAARLLRTAALLVMEHSDTQGEAVRGLVAATGRFEAIRTRRDLTGRDRFVVARRKAGVRGATAEDYS